MTSTPAELFVRTTHGLSRATMLVSCAGELCAANPAARRLLPPDGTSLWSAFDASADARAFLDACAGTLDPLPGALRRRGEVFRCTGWRLTRDDALVVLQLVPASETERFALLTQKVEELNDEIHQRRAAERAVEALQSVTAALSAASTPAEIAGIVLPTASRLFGAVAGTVYMRRDDRVELVGEHGYPEGALTAYRTLLLEAHLPVCDVIRTERLTQLDPDEMRREYGYEPVRDGLSTALPLRASGHVLGAIGFAFPRGRTLPGSELDRLCAFADLCAQALDRARLLETATEANRRKDEFLAILGHELRNPLAPIQSAVDVMRMRSPDTFARERDLIERHARHLGMLVDDILDLTRIAHGKITLRRNARPLRETVQRAIDLVAPTLERHHHALALDLPADLVLEADHDRLVQVIANLLDNAAKYTPPGGTIEIRAARHGEHVELRVRDNGRGIARDLLARVFEPFVQDIRTGARTPGGLGLGLAIVRGIVELHGGRIEAHSDGLGQGTEVVVSLPGACEAARDARAEVAAVLAAAPTGGARVLVVDDNRDASELLVECLANLGYHVRAASDGPAALRLVDEFVPDVALVDLGMPLMDGYELCERLRALPHLRATRFIAVTGYSQDADRDASRRAGFVAHLTKPVSAELVTATLRSVLAAAPGSASGPE